MKLVIGTRKSPLALAQTQTVRSALLEAKPDLEIEVVPMSTTGDAIADRPLAEAGGKGLFTKELEEALLARRIDIAVHSVKDMQTVLPDGLTIGCIPEREDPRDRMIAKNAHALADLPAGSKFGTSSLRRSAQLRVLRPDIGIVPLRGNVQTRLDKVNKGEVDATMLAVAGLNRLELFDTPGFTLSVNEFLPAIGQGALGIECREEDGAILDLLSPLADFETERAVMCERAFLQALGGSCRAAVAGYATVDGKELHFKGMVFRPDGSDARAIQIGGSSDDAETLGMAAGEELLSEVGEGFIT